MSTCLLCFLLHTQSGTLAQGMELAAFEVVPLCFLVTPPQTGAEHCVPSHFKSCQVGNTCEPSLLDKTQQKVDKNQPQCGA